MFFYRAGLATGAHFFMDIILRKSLQPDGRAISSVIIAAFGGVQGREITGLVSDLLEDPGACPLLSLVATVKHRIVGYILFTSTQIRNSRRQVSSAILAPLAVHPEYQHQGIGGQLIREGIEQLKTAGIDLVFVLGHPGYYPKYGFSPAGSAGFDAPYPVPVEHSAAWMVQELHSGVIGDVRGQVVCADALNDPRHWRE